MYVCVCIYIYIYMLYGPNIRNLYMVDDVCVWYAYLLYCWLANMGLQNSRNYQNAVNFNMSKVEMSWTKITRNHFWDFWGNKIVALVPSDTSGDTRPIFVGPETETCWPAGLGIPWAADLWTIIKLIEWTVNRLCYDI